MRMPFESAEAQKLNKEIFETIYFAAMETSMELAIKEGPYEQVLARSGGKTAIERNKSISDDVLEKVKRSCALYESVVSVVVRFPLHCVDVFEVFKIRVPTHINNSK